MSILHQLLPKRLVPRTLRTYERIAHTVHYCDDCPTPILPGNPYSAEVVVCNRKLVTYKKHEPHCPFDEYRQERDMDEFAQVLSGLEQEIEESSAA